MTTAPRHVSLRWLGYQLGVPKDELARLSDKAGRYYAEFSVRKGSRVRVIHPPRGKLKTIQRRIYLRLLKPIEFPKQLHGGIAGRSPRTNAQQHLGARYLVKLDVKEFFDSIRPIRIFKVWCQLGYSPSLARLLTKLTTFQRSLPQGGPASAALANLVLAPADERIVRALGGSGTEYTRYIDDICISGDYPQRHIQEVVRQIQREGFRVQRRKTRVRSRGHRQEVTGFVVNDAESVGKSRSRRSAIRATINKLGQHEEVSEKDLHRLLGRIADVRAANPAAAARLRKQLDGRVSNCTATTAP